MYDSDIYQHKVEILTYDILN